MLIVLLAAGTEFLRRQVAREFPDRVTTGSPHGIAATIAGRMREGRERVVGARGAGEPAAPAGDTRVAELERLAKLRDADVLSAEEFAAEKQRILSDAP